MRIFDVKKVKFLFVGQLPPPMHGQAMVNKLVFEADFSGIESVILPMRYSRSIDEVGTAGLYKILHLLKLILSTWFIWLTERPAVLYYPPASANKVPVLRDVIYLGMTRFLFKKTVFHFHAGGLGQYLDSIGIIGKIARWVYRAPDLAIELYKEPDSPGAYLSAKKVAIIPNGLEVGDAVKSKERADLKPFKLFFLGSLCEGKGVLDVLKTVHNLKQKGVFCSAQIAGGWSSEVFKQEALTMVENLDLVEEIEWLGLIRGEEKWNVFRHADCFFFPSFYRSEKFPLVLIEALGMGLPVVSTRWRGIPQLLKGSAAGVLCDTQDIEAFTLEIEKMAKDESKLMKMRRNALAHYEKHYTLNKFLESVEVNLLEVANS